MKSGGWQVMDEKTWEDTRRLQWTYSLRRAVEMLSRSASDRRLRLFAIALCRNLGDLLTDPRLLQAVALADELAEGPVDDDEILDSRRALELAVGRDRSGRSSTDNQMLLDGERAVYGLLLE